MKPGSDQEWLPDYSQGSLTRRAMLVRGPAHRGRTILISSWKYMFVCVCMHVYVTWPVTYCPLLASHEPSHLHHNLFVQYTETPALSQYRLLSLFVQRSLSAFSLLDNTSSELTLPPGSNTEGRGSAMPTWKSVDRLDHSSKIYKSIHPHGVIAQSKHRYSNKYWCWVICWLRLRFVSSHILGHTLLWIKTLTAVTCDFES